jgi:predicted enzyme related to lactoylglutathione lyase
VQRAGAPNDLGAKIHMRILQHCFRVYADADQFEASIQFYEDLQQTKCERRVEIPETRTRAAKVGRFLILGGDQERLSAVRHVDAIFYLDSLDEFHMWLNRNGAKIVHPPREVTGGRNLTARHPDGLVVEYFEAAAS